VTTKTLTVSITDKQSVSLELAWSGISQQSLYLQIGFWPVTPDNDAKVLKYLRNKVQRFLNDTRFIFNSLPAGSTIVDVGAGNSIVDLILELAYPEKNFKYVLVDSNETMFDNNLVNRIYNCQHSFDNNYVTYNSWDFVAEAIRLNKLDASKFTFCNPSNVTSIESCGAIISLASWGWHYPIGTYLDLCTKLDLNGYLCINPVLNSAGAISKITQVLGKPVVLQSLEFKPTRYQDAERARLTEFLLQHNIPEECFAYNGIWKRRFDTKIK
jgi:hypothetical protein